MEKTAPMEVSKIMYTFYAHNYQAILRLKDISTKVGSLLTRRVAHLQSVANYFKTVLENIRKMFVWPVSSTMILYV